MSSAGHNFQLQKRKRLLMDDISAGIDELGVLVAGHKKNAYWYGSQLSIEEARRLAPYNNATSLQVTVSVLSGHDLGDGEPQQRRRRARRDGLSTQPCDLPALPGPVVGQYTDWTPLTDRERLFPEDLDKSDPWQFKNVRVS